MKHVASIAAQLKERVWDMYHPEVRDRREAAAALLMKEWSERMRAEREEWELVHGVGAIQINCEPHAVGAPLPRGAPSAPDPAEIAPASLSP